MLGPGKVEVGCVKRDRGTVGQLLCCFLKHILHSFTFHWIFTLLTTETQRNNFDAFAKKRFSLLIVIRSLPSFVDLFYALASSSKYIDSFFHVFRSLDPYRFSNSTFVCIFFIYYEERVLTVVGFVYLFFVPGDVARQRETLTGSSGKSSRCNRKCRVVWCRKEGALTGKSWAQGSGNVDKKHPELLHIQR